MKKFLVKLWNNAVDLKIKAVARFWIIYDFFYRRIHKPPIIASVDETIDELINTQKSMARFGDGEIKLVCGKDIYFQKATPFASNKLKEVLSSNDDSIMIGIADAFGDRSRYTDEANKYWKNHLCRYRKVWYKYLIKNKKYYNASVTRQYISLNDHSQGLPIYNKMKKIWENKDIVIIEGEKSRLGVGNDLFDGAKSIKRILAPSKQAFDKYDEIFKEACKFDKNILFLIALGPAATCLAYDLSKAGYRAIDIGHIDVEYEWLLMGAEKKVALSNKMVFEAVNSNGVEECTDQKYISEIIAKIT
ncbi:MAG: SP_1767 family glycosyltransferase [Clostridia bacterium]|nr:SP_1767 family glycosyltransferase [Clostridia bacterium]